MTSKQRLKRHVTYELWADRQVLSTLVAQGDEAPADVVRLAAHLISTIDLWLDRIETRTRQHPVWPGWNLPACQRQFDLAGARLLGFVDGLHETDLSQPCHYVNSRGEEWTNSVADILEHLLLHGAYHRGQIAIRMRQAGLEPVTTDFIHAARNEII